MASASKPVFEGLPRQGLQFLADLESNNDRDWFQPRKDQFEALLRQPMLQLVEAINRNLKATAYVTDPSKAVYRIYRDTRFSKNKAPYKTHISALFWHNRLGKDGGAVLYFHVSAKEFLIAGGVYKPMPEVLLMIRQHIAEHHERLRAVLKRKALRLELGELQGEALSRPPKGFDPDHPAIDLLKRKDLLLETTLDPRVATRPLVLDELTRRFGLMVPFIDLLNEPLIARRARTKDPLFTD
jgi:uncharacterized protein (TIGR02453 family)